MEFPFCSEPIRLSPSTVPNRAVNRASKAHFRGSFFGVTAPIYEIQYAKDNRPNAPKKRKGSTFPPKMRLTGPGLVYRTISESDNPELYNVLYKTNRWVGQIPSKRTTERDLGSPFTSVDRNGFPYKVIMKHWKKRNYRRIPALCYQ